jgi:hypothetical protein
MPCIIRRVVGERFENHAEIAPGEWKLRPQIEALEQWLSQHRDQLPAGHQWVADVGFTARRDATGGGPPISLDLMRMCLEANMEIYLSEYGVET